MKDQKQDFLIPDHYLKISDYFKTLISSLKTIKVRLDDVKLFHFNIAPIINEDIKKFGFSGSLSSFNLCYLMLKRLQEKDFRIIYLL